MAIGPKYLVLTFGLCAHLDRVPCKVGLDLIAHIQL